MATKCELDLQIQEIMEKIEGVWRYQICEKTSSIKGHIKEHTETHIEGIIHTCLICSKTFGTRARLKVHKHKQHKGLSC